MDDITNQLTEAQRIDMMHTKVISDLKERQRQRENESYSNPLFFPEDTSVAKYMMQPIPPRQYILQDCLPLGKVGLLVGMGGTGKSQLAIQLGIGIASNTSICTNAWYPNNSGSVLMLLAEEDEEELHRRIKHSIDSLGLADANKKLLESNLHAKSLTGNKCLLTEKNSDFESSETTFLDELISTVSRYDNLKLIIIDPASRFRGGDENNAPDTTRFVEACEKLAKQTGATILLVHHTNKTSSDGELNQHAARGSSALVDGVRWCMTARTMTEKESKQFLSLEKPSSWYIQVKVTKSNYAPPQTDSIWLERKDNGVLDRVNLNSARESPFLDLNSHIPATLMADTQSGEIHSITSFIAKYAGKSGNFCIGKDKLKSEIERLIKDNRLKTRPATQEEKKMKRNFREALEVNQSYGRR